jgi:hypothetical protein
MEIQGAPDVYLYFYPSPDIFARGPNDELLEFFHPGDRWHKANLTDLAKRVGPGIDNVEDVLIAGDPHGYDFFYWNPEVPASGRTQHVVARSRENKLLEYSWNEHEACWKVVSLTDYAVIEPEDRAEVGNPLIAGDPHGYEFRDSTQHVVARGLDDQLLEWSWSKRDATWRVVSLTDVAIKDGPGIGEALISDDPHGPPVVARGLPPESRLLLWFGSSRDATWRVQNNFPTRVG